MIIFLFIDIYKGINKCEKNDMLYLLQNLVYQKRSKEKKRIERRITRRSEVERLRKITLLRGLVLSCAHARVNATHPPLRGLDGRGP